MMSAKIRGPWPLERIEQFFADTAVPMRLGCLATSGWPAVLSHWYVYRDGALWCATQATAKVVRFVRTDPRCAFEVATNAPPYQGVRGQGRATIHPDRGVEILRQLIGRYLGDEGSRFARWLLSRADSEVAIRIDPVRLTSWDFTRRMTGAR